jgi:hypothetical protein
VGAELVWTHVVADALIAAAYFSIPIAIIRFVTGRKDIEFSWIFWLFALFIVACGTTHSSRSGRCITRITASRR